MKKTLSFLIILIVVAACKKSNTAPSSAENQQDSYQPVSKNSYWKYNFTNFLAQTGTITLTMTGEMETNNSLVFHKVSAIRNTIVYSHGFYHENGDYIMHGSLTGVYDRVRYLKDNFEIGQTWEDSGVTYGYPIKIVGKIVEKGIVRTVAGKQYTNVIHTQLKITQSVLGGPYVDFQTSDFYMAKGIGLIEIINVSTNGTDNNQLIEYSIK